MLFVSRDRQVRLRGEEMVKTAFVDAGPLADLIHAHSAVTVVPDQVEGHLEQFLLSITRFSHTPHKLPDLTGQSSGLFKNFPCSIPSVHLGSCEIHETTFAPVGMSRSATAYRGSK